MNILLADDENSIRVLVDYNLSKAGHDVILAENGRDAFYKAVENADSLDLILLDVMMPVRDGLQVCSELKNDPRTVHIPVFMFTAKTQLEDIKLAKAAGANDYISKPFDADELDNIIMKKFRKIKK